MPMDLSNTTLLVIYTLTFLCQIFVASIHYPGVMVRRAKWVINHYPPSDYPKLYPGKTGPIDTADLIRWFDDFRVFNYLIAGIGLALVALMLFSGFKPRPEGGEELYVVLYFLLQAAPNIYLAYKEMKQHKAMRATYKESRRSAELKPRRLFDYIEPAYVITAVIFYAGWLAIFLGGMDQARPIGGEVYGSIALITAMNLAYVWIISRYIYGKKINPYQTPQDQHQMIETTVRTLVISSIMVSLFLSLTILADRYALEVFDPVVTSFYMQLCLFFGVGLTFRSIKVEEMDFSVYREETTCN